MIQNIEDIVAKAESEIANAHNADELKTLEKKFLGRKGELTLLLREISNVPPEERGAVGKAGNEAKKEIEAALADQLFALDKEKVGEISEEDFIDITVPPKKTSRGKRHPIHAAIEEIEAVYARMGFQVAEGPEIEDDWHNFTALNIPQDHPAREMQDTFWLDGKMSDHVLRTQTSGIQIRFMEKQNPPIRIIAPGKVFRKDSDATHSPMFHQYEGLMIDKYISLSHLKFVLISALKELVSPDIEIRFRLSFFPFTEPSLEVDGLLHVDGKKKWLEIGGAGMVHPNVIRNAGHDPKVWNGFAFGFGIERQIMIKHGISDLRLFFENDLRFLEQF